MKILHVDPERSFAGGERQVLGLIRHLAKRGHENLLAAPEGTRLWSLVPEADARKVALAIRNDLDLRAALRLALLVARERPSILHFHTSRAHAMSLWLPDAPRRGIVTRRMDYAIRKGLRTHVLYNRRVAGVAAISVEVRRQLLAGGVEPERIRLIASGVEASDGLPGPSARRAARERFGADDDEMVIAVVAALEHRKGHDVLLRALAALRERAIRFRCLVCGEGSRRGEIERLAAELGLGAAVQLLGEQRQIADVLAASDVFVLPSRQEGLGVAILEAMAMAIPVVASAVGGIPESIEHGCTGFLVPPEDPLALAEALAMVAREPSEARAMGARGYERVLERFTMAGMAEAYERFYVAVNGRCGTGSDRR